MTPQDQNQQGRSSEQQQSSDQIDKGHSGEGADSAFARMVAQNDSLWRQTGEADDAAGHTP